MLSLIAANERTFLAWLHMAVTMGGIITALSSFSVETENEAKGAAGSSPVTRRTTEAIQLMLLPISIGMVAYALFTFYWRSRCMERKQVRHLDVSLRSDICDHVHGLAASTASGVPFMLQWSLHAW